jgi:hypothetical protein
VTAEPSASIWEVTRLILENPERSPTDIAHEHGYSPAEIAEHLPIFLDTARTDWAAHVDVGGDRAVPIGADAADLDPELYLRDLAGSGAIDVAGFDAAAGHPDLGPDAGPDLDGDLPAEAWTAGDGGPPPPDPGELLDGPDPIPAAGDPVDDPGDALDDTIDDAALDDVPPHDAVPDPDGHQLALGEDDPFGNDPLDGDPYDSGSYDSGAFTDDPFGDPTGLEPDPAADVDDAVDGPHAG